MPGTQFHPLFQGLWVWQNYSRQVKADLFSTAIQTRSGIYLIDPIQYPEAELGLVAQTGRIAGVIVTNMNHWRATASYAGRFSVPIFARSRDRCHPISGSARLVGHGAMVGDDLEVIEIPGAGPAEIALYYEANGGTLIVGDALINFEPYGFTFLPGKYCENEKQMRCSLRQLLAKPAERILFAHGTPILRDATAHLGELLCE